jgi:hypothetical protein
MSGNIAETHEILRLMSKDTDAVLTSPWGRSMILQASIEIQKLEAHIEELEADNARLRDLLSDIDAVTIWESGGTVPDRSMQGRVDAALDVMGKENSTVEKMRRVIVESPYAGDVEANVEYARAALYDCLMRGEAPFASHLLYTQPGVLDDSIPDERLDGIYAGLAWADVADAVVVYTDRGISDGMQYGITRHKESGRTVEYRSLADTGNKYDYF